MKTRSFLSMALLFLVALALTPAVQAQPQHAPGNDNRPAGALQGLLDSAPTTAEGRLQLWQTALQRLVEGNAELDDEQLFALLSAVDTVRSAHFMDPPTNSGLETIRQNLATLERTLSEDQYLSMLRNFQGLQGWLYEQGLIQAFVIAPGDGDTCNCNSNRDCSNSTCQSVTCTSQSGSKAWGICGGGGAVQ